MISKLFSFRHLFCRDIPFLTQKNFGGKRMIYQEKQPERQGTGNMDVFDRGMEKITREAEDAVVNGASVDQALTEAKSNIDDLADANPTPIRTDEKGVDLDEPLNNANKEYNQKLQQKAEMMKAALDANREVLESISRFGKARTELELTLVPLEQGNITLANLKTPYDISLLVHTVHDIETKTGTLQTLTPPRFLDTYHGLKQRADAVTAKLEQPLKDFENQVQQQFTANEADLNTLESSLKKAGTVSGPYEQDEYFGPGQAGIEDRYASAKANLSRFHASYPDLADKLKALGNSNLEQKVTAQHEKIGAALAKVQSGDGETALQRIQELARKRDDAEKRYRELRFAASRGPQFYDLMHTAEGERAGSEAAYQKALDAYVAETGKKAPLDLKRRRIAALNGRPGKETEDHRLASN